MCFAAREHWTSSSSSSRVFELRLSAGHTQIRHWTKPSFGGYGVKVKAKVIVMPKAAVLDPQGNAVRYAMQHLGMPEVRSVRIGKYMEIDIDGQNGDLETRLRGLCRDLLSNPVIEDYQLQNVATTNPLAGDLKSGDQSRSKSKRKKQ
jgi:phosphoribosylformylglycinamidine synthase PurS subunit